MNRRLLVSVVVVLALLLVLAIAGTGILAFQLAQSSQPVPAQITRPFAGPTATLRAQTAPPATPLARVSTATYDALVRTDIPERNLYEIVPRLRKDSSLLTPVPTPARQARKLGDKDTFFVVENASTGKYRTVTATLQVVVPHAYYWVEDGIRVDAAALQRSADFFEKSIYPTNHEYFGEELSPGPDGDVHIHILNTRFEDAAGYFSSEDTFPRKLVPFSNERNIIYLNADAVKPGTDEYSADTAHEFQHLIHSYEAQHKTGWIDEGMGDLAIKVNGFEVGGVLRLFGRNPDTQLNTWANEPQASLAHYAASYLFFNYTAMRFGPDFTRNVIHAPHEGINGVQAVLDKMNPRMSFEDLFADWAVTNYLNDDSIENGLYSYPNERSFRITNEPVLSQFPVSRSSTMRQYATNYLGLVPRSGDVTVYFTGTTSTRLLPTEPQNGNWMWYSNRADLANMTLTREVNLSQATKATLQFSTWYDIEKNFDYGYAEVSTDNGKTWSILSGKTSNTENPNGASYGPAFTGRSGGQTEKGAQWVQEQADLTAYVGKTVLLRFEYITDDAYNAPGWAVDDISIPELNWTDTVEEGDGAWLANGFVRTDNILPQRFTVQVVKTGKTTRVDRVELDDQNRGSFTIAGFGGDVSRAELVITTSAPTTTELAGYEFSVVAK